MLRLVIDNHNPQPTAYMARPWVEVYREQAHCAEDVATWEDALRSGLPIVQHRDDFDRV